MYQELGDIGDVAQACKRTQASRRCALLVIALVASTLPPQQLLPVPALPPSAPTSRRPCCTAQRRSACRACLLRFASWRLKRGRVRCFCKALLGCGFAAGLRVLVK